MIIAQKRERQRRIGTLLIRADHTLQLPGESLMRKRIVSNFSSTFEVWIMIWWSSIGRFKMIPVIGHFSKPDFPATSQTRCLYSHTCRIRESSGLPSTVFPASREVRKKYTEMLRHHWAAFNIRKLPVALNTTSKPSHSSSVTCFHEELKKPCFLHKIFIQSFGWKQKQAAPISPQETLHLPVSWWMCRYCKKINGSKMWW